MTKTKIIQTKSQHHIGERRWFRRPEVEGTLLLYGTAHLLLRFRVFEPKNLRERLFLFLFLVLFGLGLFFTGFFRSFDAFFAG